jgi:hypothetical protein
MGCLKSLLKNTEQICSPVVRLVGTDHEVAHVPASARALLSRCDERAIHYHHFHRREQKG